MKKIAVNIILFPIGVILTLLCLGFAIFGIDIFEKWEEWENENN